MKHCEDSNMSQIKTNMTAVKKRQRFIPNLENVKGDLHRVEVIMKSLLSTSVKLPSNLQVIQERYLVALMKANKPSNKVVRPMQVDSNALKIIEKNELESLIAGLSPIR